MRGPAASRLRSLQSLLALALRLSLLLPCLNSGRDWLTRRDSQVSRDMPGWDSLQTVSAVHGAFQLAGLILLVVLAALAAFAAYQLRDRQWPEWLDVGEYQLRSRFFEIGCAAVFALLLVSEVVAYSYGLRQDTLAAAAEQASADRIKRLTAEVKARPVADTPSRYLKENSELRQKLIDAENKLAALERTQTQKHLSQEQKRFLIEALRPFAGQKVSIASIRGDDEGLAARAGIRFGVRGGRLGSPRRSRRHRPRNGPAIRSASRSC